MLVIANLVSNCYLMKQKSQFMYNKHVQNTQKGGDCIYIPQINKQTVIWHVNIYLKMKNTTEQGKYFILIIYWIKIVHLHKQKRVVVAKLAWICAQNNRKH